MEVLILLKKELRSFSIVFPSSVPYVQRNAAESYYLNNKNLLTAEFFEVLSVRVRNFENSTSIEGMLTPIPGEEHHFLFKSMEPEDIYLRKIKRSNFSEFEEAQ